MHSYARERAVDQIASVAARGLDLRAFWDAAAEAVSSIVPHYGAPCWFTLDPASLLVTSHYDHGQIPDLPSEWLAHEYYDGEDVPDMVGVARSQRGLSTLHEASGGDPSRRLRYDRAPCRERRGGRPFLLSPPAARSHARGPCWPPSPPPPLLSRL